MSGLIENPPVKSVFLVPLAQLPELRAHEQQLLARMSPHKSQISADVGQLLPAIARHFGQQGALAVHNFVVADG